MSNEEILSPGSDLGPCKNNEFDCDGRIEFLERHYSNTEKSYKYDGDICFCERCSTEYFYNFITGEVSKI
jgi:hypothetical protein